MLNVLILKIIYLVVGLRWGVLVGVWVIVDNFMLYVVAVG